MEFGQLIEYNDRNIFFQNDAKSELRRLVPDLFLVFKKALYKAKENVMQLSFTIFR